MHRISAALIFALPMLTGCATLVPLAGVLDGNVPSGSIVAIRGYVSLEFEGQSIHESRQECESYDTKRALWVDIRRNDIPKDWQHCSFAEVSGVFRADDTGHFGGWPSGSIVSVSGIRALRR